MMPDDCSLTPSQLAKIRQQARRALQEAGTLGILPTPVDRLLRVAQVTEVQEDVLNDSFLAKFRRSITDAYRQARSKVQGLFSSIAGLVIIDKTLVAVRRRFVSFHEAAHGFLGWQRSLYKLVEDGEDAIDPDAADLFDREANVFASEVLFQNDLFHEMASDSPFTIWTPIKLAKSFEASLYASIRQYVSKNERRCIVLVYNKPELVEGDGFRATLRRPISSASFREAFAGQTWPEVITPDHPLGRFVPLGVRRGSGKRNFSLTDANGDHHECVAESFTQKRHVFILIHAVKTLGQPRIIIPSASAPSTDSRVSFSPFL